MIETFKQLPEEDKKGFALACQQALLRYKEHRVSRTEFKWELEAVVEKAKQQGHL